MQTLKQRKDNTPTSASQASSNCDLQLNKEETLSVASSKTSDNNPEVNRQQRTVGLNAIVYVVSLKGAPLMPCSRAKARKLRKNKRAIIYKFYPFTIKLLFECENGTQQTKLGIDTGYGNIGISAITDKKELASGTVLLDNKTSERLTEKRMYRKGRRRELRYREPRFLNRKKPEGWLPPSIQRRYDAHVKLINLYQEILPIKEEDITIEIGQFDTAKLINPEIYGEGYQQGDLYGYENVKAFLFAREKGCCQMCNEEIKKGQKVHIHHCKERGEAGTNSPKNLALLHEKCHKKLHKKGMKLSAPKEYKGSTFMAITANKFKKDFPDCKTTFGYITSVNRVKFEILKSHFNDAFVIAGGQNQERCTPIEIRQKHRNNRVLQLNRKGFAPSIRKQRYKIQPKDLIWIEGKKLVASGVQCKGKFIMTRDLKKSYPVRQIEKTFNFGGFAYN